MNATNKNTDIKKIKSEISTLKKSLLNFKFQKSTGQLEKTSEIRKTTTARIVAKALNCSNGIDNLCKENFCESCKSISEIGRAHV